MAGKEPTDAELDNMIDQSVKDMKEEKKTKQAKGGKKEAEPKHAEEKKTKAAQKDADGGEPNKEGQKEEKGAKKPEHAGAKPPKQTAKTVPLIKGEEGYDAWKILQYPHLAEKSMNMVEIENKLVFIVRRDARKDKIKEAIEKGFGVKVLSVNVTITRKGHKKAYIKLHPDCSAADIATRLGMI